MAEQASIRPQLRAIDLTFIVMGLVIGMGIFRTPSEVAGIAGQTDIFLLVWIAGGIVSFIGALIFAEIGSRYPKAGGFYKLISHAYHPRFAFMVNWITVISNAASTALVALLGAEYLAEGWFTEPNQTWASRAVAIASVVLLYGVNLLGIRLSSRILNALMIVKIVLLAVVISTLFLVDAAPTQVVAHYSPASTDWWKAFALCFVPVFFTYGGYQQTMNFGGDVKDASRIMPRAILKGMLLVTLIYVLANYAYLHALGIAELHADKTLAATMTGKLLGSAAAKFVSGVMFFSVLAYAHVSIMSNPRVYFAMAEDGVMPRILARINPKTQVQEYALGLFVAIILITLFFADSFEYLLQYVMFFDSIGFMAAAGAIFVFRKKGIGDVSHPFRMRGYPWLPLLFIAVYFIITITIFYNNYITAALGFGLFLFGGLLYEIIQRTSPSSLD